MKQLYRLAGELAYEPEVKLDDDLRLRLQLELEEADLVQYPENPCVVADWIVDNAEPPFGAREIVFMYRDGGDAEDPACLFCRNGWARDDFQIHIPPLEDQDRLCDAWDWGRAWVAEPERLKIIKDYLTTVLNKVEAWRPLAEIAD